jgi:hypothetical protein
VNLYDRFFFCGYPTTGDLVGQAYFAVAFGTYPGRNIVDAAFSVIVDGVQHNVRGSRLMGENRLDLHVGPVTIEILEPLRSLRVRVDSPDGGIRADLVFHARGPAFEEPHYRWAPGHLTVFDITRLTQNGNWTGWIETPSQRFEVNPLCWLGTRDRSWGIRPIGARATNMAPDGPPPAFYWLWAPMNFPDLNVIFDVNETPAGTRWHENAAVAPVLEADAKTAGETNDIRHGTHTYSALMKNGTRHAETFIARFSLPNINPGEPDENIQFTMQSKLTFFMSGIGYGHPTWGHGMFVGPDEQTYDSFVLADVDESDLAVFNHVQIFSTIARFDANTGKQVAGHGILEMLISGPHAPSGFTGYLDTATVTTTTT